MWPRLALSRFRGPLADSYPAAVALVVCALVPFLTITGAVFPLLPVLGKDLGLSKHTLEVTIAMSDAAYAFGTVLAVQFAVHLPARRMLLLYVSTFLVAAVLAAWAPSGGVFVGAFIAEGLCTSLMLIAAVPPLVIGWPPGKMPWTGMIMNLCIFGAVAVGPTVGAGQLTSHGWRPLFWGVAGVAALAVLFAVLTFEDVPPQDDEAPWDLIAIALAGVGCAGAFFGAGELLASGRAGWESVGPLVLGALLILVLVVYQYRLPRPLMPVKQLATTFPVAGIVIAMSASAAAFGLMELVLTGLQSKASPTHVALVFLPEFGAAIATAALFGVLFRTRFTPVLAMSGMAVLAVAAALLTAAGTGSGPAVAVGAGLIGFGVGASVSPALFIAGFSLRSAQIQRVFALIELLRGVTAFLVAPILVFLSTVLATDPATGIRRTMLICLGISLTGGGLALAVFRLGRARLQVPDLERWGKGEPAWESRPLVGTPGVDYPDGREEAAGARAGNASRAR